MSTCITLANTEMHMTLGCLAFLTNAVHCLLSEADNKDGA